MDIVTQYFLHVHFTYITLASNIIPYCFRCDLCRVLVVNMFFYCTHTLRTLCYFLIIIHIGRSRFSFSFFFSFLNCFISLPKTSRAVFRPRGISEYVYIGFSSYAPSLMFPNTLFCNMHSSRAHMIPSYAM